MRKRKSLPMILAMLWLAWPTILAAESTPQSQAGPLQVSPPASRLYTEAEARAAIEAGIAAALAEAVPRAVQAAVAEERGARVAAEALARDAEAEAARAGLGLTLWRAGALAASGACLGALADGQPGALYGAGGGLALDVLLELGHRLFGW